MGDQALAQAAPSVSPPTREEIERGVREGTLEQQRAAVSIDAAEVERAPCPLASPDFGGIHLKVEAVDFTGTEKIPEVDLSQSYHPYLGTDQPVSVICEIRDRAATQLRAAGYLAAVQVPPQTIESGRVKLDILLARMSKVQVKGDAGASEKLLVRYISKLTQDEVFNTRRAERYLLLARDIPGLDVRLALRPVEGSPGEVVGEVTVRRNPVYADFTVQNLGSKSVGRWSGLARAQVSGLTGLGDATTVSVFSTADFDEQVVLQAGHEFRVGGEGLTIRGDLTYGWTRPSIANNPDIESRTLIASLEAAYPFVRAQSHNLSGAVGFDLIDQKVDFGAVKLNKDKLRVAFVRLDANGISQNSISGRDGFTALEPNWSWAASIEARQGLDVFDATPDCGGATLGCIAPGAPTPSRIEGDPTAFVLRAAGEVDWRPVRNLTISVAPRVQYAPHALLSYEEYSGGNYTVGRGYDPGAIIGDSGVGVRSEVRVGSLLPRTAGGVALQPYAFFDAAKVWNEDTAFDGVGGQQLYSAGAGVRATIRDAARLDALVAVPLRDAFGAPNAKGDVRFLVNFTLQLAPWRW
ncbi:ShlB/FhaC/HecB family hemolysin secretion/activation protein [Novosphingobium sp. Gsoil 351]|uniref:ShlB/FhaC/HecB family hemolysin secretion/activation protein n=1 Tax=Novosphingobium sp. Gsoil 351 TaxID=2675225 RepID=UPI001E371FC4|nr:ShlB/FhaC/HecB family hemolysin secretion/activation protein [Novosphingobium sp. Gsoil 351]